jgi:hypothetical protein
VRCIRCGHDSKYKDRSNQTCPQCKRRFAFEPRQGAKLTDQAFQNAIERVSGGGKVRWGAEHLYYEIGRRLRPRVWLRTRFQQVLATIPAAGLALAAYEAGPLFVLGYLIVGGGLVTHQLRRARATTIGLEEAQFREMLTAWERVHGKPAGLIERPTASVARRPSRTLEHEMVDYSFDRAVICDRARTVDMLLANNFHFENNCAVLTSDGYPPGPFETVRIMLKRNPKLQVFALHDATVEGCTLAHRLTSDPSWFAGQVPVIDVGLRPGHAEPFRGLWLPAQVPFVSTESGIKPAEAEWLGKYALELAAIRPDQVLKRLFRAMNRQTERDGNGGGDGDGLDIVYFEQEERHSYVIEDQDSFSADASADDGGADSFG